MRTRVGVDDPHVPTVVDLFPTADFQEREVYDMFGVVFDGHPDMRRILMPEDYEGYPQRRDFPMGGEPVHLHLQRARSCRAGMTDLRRPGTMTEALDVPYRERERSVTMEPMGEEHDELLTINIGPHHPATHGVLRLLTTLEGEIVRDVKPIIGYVHTGIEKSCEDQQYWKVIPFVERMDYLAYYFNAMAFCMAVESLLDEEVPPRAQWLRVIHLELNRIASHLFWIATGALDIGAITMLWWGCRDRDLVLDLFEMSGGQRFHTRYFQVGGVVEDIPPGFEEMTRKFIKTMPHAHRRSTSSLLDRNEIWLQRTKGTGIVPAEDLLGARRDRAAAARRRPPVGPAQGDAVLGLRALRLQGPGRHRGRQLRPLPRAHRRDARVAARSSSRRSTACPRGRSSPTNRKVALPPRHELATSMEALIHHFKLVTEGFRVPPGEAYAAIESPRGELGCFVLADGSAKPARVHMRDPSFVNLQALPEMARDSLLADFIACVAMLDPILGGVDR